ncbi:hypothetical protein MMC07_007778, partial [Pseudocyphellaria aurata]|nr:hypothetical protein [Pseudocyphellaria aurata]
THPTQKSKNPKINEKKVPDVRTLIATAKHAYINCTNDYRVAHRAAKKRANHIPQKQPNKPKKKKLVPLEFDRVPKLSSALERRGEAAEKKNGAGGEKEGDAKKATDLW